MGFMINALAYHVKVIIETTTLGTKIIVLKGLQEFSIFKSKKIGKFMPIFFYKTLSAFIEFTYSVGDISVCNLNCLLK